MTDRELLEAAARAFLPAENLKCASFMAGFMSNWNPLTDDGDALRLAVKLRLTVNCSYSNVAVVGQEFKQAYFMKECNKDDPYAATRRAIVRAAAELGKQA